MPIICAEAMTMIRRAAENGSDVYRGMRHCRFPIFPDYGNSASVKLRAPSRSHGIAEQSILSHSEVLKP